jgi:hypothetical protein
MRPGTRTLAAWVLALRGIGCHFRGEYELSAALLDRAEEAAASSSLRRGAWVAALSARAQTAVAARRDEPGAVARDVMHAVDGARACLDAAGPPSDTDFFDAPRLAGMAGTALLMLRDTCGACEYLGEALAGRNTADVKGRALLTLDLAGCMAAADEPGQAAALASGALGMASGGGAVSCQW